MILRNLLFLYAFVCANLLLGQQLNICQSGHLGDSSNVQLLTTSTEHKGNFYVAGLFRDAVDFDFSAAVHILSPPNGNSDLFIAKYDSSYQLQWVIPILGTHSLSDVQTVSFLGVDQQDNVIISGRYRSTMDFDPDSTNTFILGNQNSLYEASYAAKYDANGHLVWAKSIASSNNAISNFASAMDAAGNIYLSGGFSGSTDFDPDTSSFVINATAGGRDIFVLKLNTNGEFVFVRQIAGSNDETARALSLDASGNILIAGQFQGTVDFDPGMGQSNLTAQGLDPFICKLDSNGNLAWANKITGPGNDQITALQADALDNVYFIGTHRDSISFDGSSIRLPEPADIQSAYLAKMGASGSFQWAKAIRSSRTTWPRTLLINHSDLYVVGGFWDTLNIEGSTNQWISNGREDAFIAAYDTTGLLVDLQAYGGSRDDNAASIAIRLNGSIYVSGAFRDSVNVTIGNTSRLFKTNSINGVYCMDLCINPLSVWELGEGAKMNVSLSPNPSSDYVFVHAEHKLRFIRIYNTKGQLIKVVNQPKVEVSELPAGPYIFQVMTEKGFTSASFIKR